MITIGQLADYAGVTIKAVRHYHQRGLLEEPPRDASGYRRYGADHAVQLLKIKTLADAGVPLARIQELLGTDPERLSAAVAQIDGQLQQRITDLRRTRERLAQLRGGDRLFVSAEVADYLDRLRGLGISPRTVQLERDGWILIQSVSPQDAANWLTDKAAALDDPEFRAIYLEYDAAFDWSPDDPRLPGLAERTRRWMAGRRAAARAAQPVAAAKEGAGSGPRNPAVAQLAATSGGTSSPAWDRLTQLARQAAEGG